MTISLNIANTIRLATIKMPSLNEYSRKESETGEPFIFSIAITTSCPPSKMGIGNNFINPKFMLKIAIIDKNENNPAFAAEPANKEI